MAERKFFVVYEFQQAVEDFEPVAVHAVEEHAIAERDALREQGGTAGVVGLTMPQMIDRFMRERLGRLAGDRTVTVTISPKDKPNG